MQAFCRSQSLANKLDLMFRRRNTVLRFLLKRVQHVNFRREPHRIDRPVGTAIIILNQFKDACAAEAPERLRLPAGKSEMGIARVAM